MKIKRIKKIKINSFNFTVNFTKEHNGGDFNYKDREINIGTKGNDDARTFDIICHEVFEIVAVEMNVRLNRPDCDSDYIFVFDHRQHETMMNMFASIISQFVE